MAETEPGQAWEELLAAAREEHADADEEQIEKLAERQARLDWIRQRWPDVYLCELCGNRKWTVSDPGSIGPQVLAFPVSCRYCGNTKLLVPDVADLDEAVGRDD